MAARSIPLRPITTRLTAARRTRPARARSEPVPAAASPPPAPPGAVPCRAPLTKPFTRRMSCASVHRLAGAASNASGAAISGSCEGKTVEIIMFMRAVQGVVMRGPRRQITRPAAPSPSRIAGSSLPCPRRHRLHRAPEHRCLDVGVQPRKRRRVEQVGLVQHHQIGRPQLVLVHLRQRVVVIERQVLGRAGVPPPPDRRRTAPTPLAGPSTTASTPSTVTSPTHRRPDERLQQRLGQGEARGFNDDVLRRLRPVQQRLAWWAGIRPPRCSTGSHWPARRYRPRRSREMPQLRSVSPSMPSAPNSLTITAIRRPPACSSKCRTSVVLPAPRKPVTMVAGMRPAGIMPASPNPGTRGATTAFCNAAGRGREGSTAPLREAT